MSGWKPIETAPKDGTYILAFGGVNAGYTPRSADIRYSVVQWKESWGHRYEEVEGGLFKKTKVLFYALWDSPEMGFEPTHWMPLPEDPK